MGIGTDNVYLIDTDAFGKMDMNHLGMTILMSQVFIVYQIHYV